VARSGWRTAFLVGGLATLVFCAGIPLGLSSMKTVVGADRVLAGELPYRDFWTMYAPGSFYALAALFRFVARELWVQGLACCLALGASAALFHRIQREQGLGERPSLILSAIVVVMLWRPAPELSSYPCALPLLLGALLLVLRHLRAEAGGLLRAGLCLGAAACFKHDVAGYVAIGLTGALWVSWMVSWRGGERPAGRMHPGPATFLLAVSALVVAAPVGAFFAMQAGGDAWEDLFRFPAGTFPLVFADPWPGWLPELGLLFAWLRDPGDLRLGQSAFGGLSAWAACILPHVFFWGGLGMVLVRGRSWPLATLGNAILWLALLPLFHSAAHVQQNTHVWSMGLACLSLWGMAWRVREHAKPVRVLLLALLVVYAGGHALRPAMSLFVALRELPGGEWLELPGARGIRVPAQQAAYLRPIANRVRAEVPLDEPIHVGLFRHDAIVVSNQQFYFLGERRPATRYNELHPGVGDRAEVQREMIADIERSGARLVVLWEFGWPEERLDAILAERRLAIPELGSTLLDEHLRERFELLERHGEYAVLRRR
jgi:hypothetical protein